MARSKRYQDEKKLVEAKAYQPAEAITLLKKISKVKFSPSVEIHIRLNVDPSQSSQLIRGSVVLPAGTGKEKRVAVFCTPEKEKEAKSAGADVVGGKELIKEIKLKKVINFDAAVAEPAMMREIGPIAPILGPKGLMPNPKTETVTPDIAKAVKALKGGKVNFRMDDGGNLHQLIGKLSFSETDLVKNLEAFLAAVNKLKPAKIKGALVKKAIVKTSMSPAVRINPA